ncbi:MAG: hypothetical protein GY760_02175 [Deltaproteobacteria bacterium]|nr:hypothetical protein [Deltaproteobacteria bacterium]
MTERLKHLGRLEEKRLKTKSLTLSIEGLRDSLRDLLDPFEPVESLKLDIVAQQAIEIAEKQISLKTLKSEIKAIKKALGL